MSLYAIAIITVIVFGTQAFIFWMGWKLGVLEAVVLVMVIGLSIDYTVHLSDAYLECDARDRHGRAQAMLTHLGESILSGAVTTLGASTFLLFTFNQFFFKFGIIIFFVICCSVIFSMVFFATLLDTIGPSGDMGNLHALLPCCANKHANGPSSSQTVPEGDVDTTP